jgi:hypothetical protein
LWLQLACLYVNTAIEQHHQSVAQLICLKLRAWQSSLIRKEWKHQSLQLGLVFA